LDTTGEVVSYTLNPLPKQLGQKYGSRFPQIRKIISEIDAEIAARKFLEGKPVPIEVDGETLDMLPEEIEVRAVAREGYAVASEGAILAALVTDLTPELIQEGLAREFVRRVQDLRKQADLDISDRIRLFYHTTPGLGKAITAFREYIKGETLSVELVEKEPGSSFVSVKAAFDGEEVTVGLEKASA
jgi:isoleucyl-tRNA synthetase